MGDHSADRGDGGLGFKSSIPVSVEFLPGNSGSGLVNFTAKSQQTALTLLQSIYSRGKSTCRQNAKSTLRRQKSHFPNNAKDHASIVRPPAGLSWIAALLPPLLRCRIFLGLLNSRRKSSSVVLGNVLVRSLLKTELTPFFERQQSPDSVEKVVVSAAVVSRSSFPFIHFKLGLGPSLPVF